MNKMMDLKEIIKWFIPCFHILLYKKVKMSCLTRICLFLILFLARPSCGANVNSFSEADTKNVVNYLDNNNQSEYFEVNNKQINEEKSLDVDTSVGRTFGRPMKKMMQALIPLAFQIGAASTWMVVAAVVGVKTLLVALVILKILLVAGAAKFGALFGQKAHGHGWEPPHQKEIHLHIHGQQGAHEEHFSDQPLKQPVYYPQPYAPATRSDVEQPRR
ncbi:uncharacterized protein LOC142984418 isoform X2 [Anticarsia gemmatalis]|uniref:uncharacterized protein LOC142984418 isoform X2 n=1 Tax=Anticarsia gemmatalis TaxID=129554 RepID=UPI003F75C42E